MSARSVPSGIRPSRSHSRRLISAPPRRPETMIFTPFAPAFIDRWMDCFMAFLKAMRRLSCWLMLVATRYASSSGWRISLISSLTLRLVSAPICWRRISTFWPPLPMTMPGLAVCTVTVTWPKLRSISRPLTLAFDSRLSTSWRIAMSSLRRSVYSLSWYHFAVHVRVTPSRNPYGWTLCPMSQPSRSPTVTVMWVTPLWIGNARPWARGRQRLMVGPSSARASRTSRSSVAMFRLFSAFAAALLSTPATSLAACWGMNLSRLDASSTERPRIASTTRRALRVDPRTYLALADTFIAGSLRRRGAVGALPVAAVGAGRGELAETMADHVLGHVDRHMLAAVVDGDRVADEGREDHARARPGLDDLLLALLVHQLDA